MKTCIDSNSRLITNHTGDYDADRYFFLHDRLGSVRQILSSDHRFTLPCWFETSVLVKQPALKFLPLRAIGWDVAITPDGPCILEANSYWDPPTPSENVPVIIDALSSNLPIPGQPANR